MIILFIILAYPIVVGLVLVTLNTKGLLPGTANYRMAQALTRARVDAARAEITAERARTDAITARYRAKEDEHINRILELEAPKS